MFVFPLQIIKQSALILAFAFLSAASASAATFTVNQSNDAGDFVCDATCTLRDAIDDANAAASDDAINFEPNISTVTLANEIVISNRGKLSINGRGADIFTIDGGAGQNRIFFISGAAVTLQNLTLTGGNGAGATFNLNGGAIYSSGGSLTLDRVHVTGNTATTGGPAAGIFFFSGTHRISNTTFSNNVTTTSCGAFFNSGGNITVLNSTFHNNSAGTGGAICNSGNLIVRNTTISGNTASRGGGGVLEFGSNTLDIGNSIVAGNIAPSGPPEIWANTPINSRGNNIIGDSPGDAANTEYQLVYHASDILETPPALGSLALNGGATPTLALLSGSPAIDRGNNSLAADPSNSNFRLITDQRFYRRTVDGDGDGVSAVDIGAFEYNSALFITATISGRATVRNRGAGRVRITLTSHAGEIRRTVTNSFGFYRFTNVPLGDGYTLEAVGKHHDFVPQIISIAGDAGDFNFTAR